MPNWCEGQLKIRGSKENIVMFIENELFNIDFLGNEWEPKFHKEIDNGILQQIYSKTTEPHCKFWIRNTRRAFIDGSIDCCFYEEDETQIVSLKFAQAWSIKVEELADISQKYNIDFKIYGFECGMAFNQDVEIISGVIMKDEKIEFNNYNWECINPSLGG